MREINIPEKNTAATTMIPPSTGDHENSYSMSKGELVSRDETTRFTQGRTKQNIASTAPTRHRRFTLGATQDFPAAPSTTDVSVDFRYKQFTNNDAFRAARGMSLAWMASTVRFATSIYLRNRLVRLGCTRAHTAFGFLPGA